MNSIYRITGSIFILLVLSLYLVCCFSSQGFFAGASSLKVISENPVSDSAPYREVLFFNEDEGLALTVSTVIRTSDGGKTWDQSFFSEEMVLSSFFRSGSSILVAGAEYTNQSSEKSIPIVIKTSDRGATWTKLQFRASSLDKKVSRFNDLCIDETGRSWLLSNGGIIEAKIEDNNVEVVKFFPTEEKLYRIACQESRPLMAVGDQGTIARYEAGNWTYQKLGEHILFTNITIINGTTWLVGRSVAAPSMADESVKGVLWRSKDAGLTWEDRTPESAEGLTDIFFIENSGWLVGLRGRVYTTVDGGENWITETPITKKNLFSVFFLNSKRGWIGGSQGVVLSYDGVGSLSERDSEQEKN